jgi:CHASE2 domain-containing sensor protein
MKFSAIYALGVGTLMLLQWAFFLLTGNVPELETAPWSIAFHLAAEFLTAIMLIISGVMLIKTHRFSKQIFLLATGMVIYAMVNSAGYFAQSGDWVFVAMFGVLLVLAGISVYRVLNSKRPSKTV